VLTRGEVVRLDAELAALCTRDAAARLRLGQALEVLGRGACFELGFSSLGAYALERCERGARWVQAARCLARRLEVLPQLRSALAAGELSWSQAELIARVATPESEAQWLALAKQHTVRQMRALVSASLPKAETSDAEASEGDEELCTLVCTVDREDAWLFEATRTLLDQLGTHTAADQLEALLAEGQGTLLAALPRGSVNAEELAPHDASQRSWNEQLAQWRIEAEALCERELFFARGPGAPASGATMSNGHSGDGLSHVAAAAAQGFRSLESASSVELDRHVQDLSRALSGHELEIARRLSSLHRANGWRRLGYATEAQYARERLGISPSLLQARRSLAHKLESLPGVLEALSSRSIGVEAAVQLVRIATAQTEAAWLERARRRTIKHLREEVAAALVAVRISGEASCWPPAEPELSAFQELERRVVGGEFGGTLRGPDGNVAALWKPGAASPEADSGEADHLEAEGEQRRAWRAMLGSLWAWFSGGCQASAGPQGAAAANSPVARRQARSAGRVELRWRVPRSTHTWWRVLEAKARRWLPAGMSWLRFLCLSLWRAWRHMLGSDVVYGQIYVRDRFRCTSPVCNRRDVTPHHLQFRSAGGSDEDENVAAVCTWCHLFGVHGGRIRAEGSASAIHWELGPREQPCVVVQGRERVAA
jgi:hypothetical protein